MNKFYWSKITASILPVFIACQFLATAIDSNTARTAAQAWINNGYSMRHLSAKTVSDIQPQLLLLLENVNT